jgi:hypothetical protein
MVLMIGLCITAIIVTGVVCYTHYKCVLFKYRTQEQPFVSHEPNDLQTQIDEAKEKIPTMEEMVFLAQQMIGGADEE